MFFIDTETTGLTPEKDRVIQIAMVDDIPESGGHQSLVYVDVDVPIEASSVNGITTEKLKQARHDVVDPAPTFEELLPSLYKLIPEDSTVVAHNAAFDCQMLYIECARVSPDAIEWFKSLSVIDTLVAARNQFPHKRHNLDALAEIFGVLPKEPGQPCHYGHSAILKQLFDDGNVRHSAIIDAMVLREVYKLWVKQVAGSLYNNDVFSVVPAISYITEVQKSIAADFMRENGFTEYADGIALKSTQDAIVFKSRPRVILPTQDELDAHNTMMKTIEIEAGQSGNDVIWCNDDIEPGG